MSDQTQTPAVVVPVAPIPVPSTAQVVSAALQNVVVALIIGAAWLLDKLDTTVAVVALLLVVGIDFAGRRKLPTSTTAAVSLGATGILHVLGGSGVVGAMALALVGCSAVPAADLAPAKTAISVSENLYTLACTDPAIYARIPKACEDAYTALTAAVNAYNAADKAATDAATK